MEIEVTDDADNDLSYMDESQREKFIKHMRKIASMQPTRHFKEHYVEQVGEGRIIYQIDLENDVVFILRCFARHKDYDKWCDFYR